MQNYESIWENIKDNQWFISTGDKVCQKYDEGHMLVYNRGPYGPPSRLIHISFSDEFEVKRLATPEEIKSKVTEDSKNKQEESDFIFIAKEYENPAYVSARFEKEYLEHVMSKCRYNQSKAAILLSISRGTLRKKLNLHFPGKYLAKRDE